MTKLLNHNNDYLKKEKFKQFLMNFLEDKVIRHRRKVRSKHINEMKIHLKPTRDYR